MGLGPPVYKNCEVIMKLTDYKPPWTCPKCGCGLENSKSLWTYSGQKQEQIEKKSEY